MCSDDCKCYAGEGNATKILWESYGDQPLYDFNRNVKEVMSYKKLPLDEDAEEGEFRTIDDPEQPIYPLQWGYDPLDSINTFQECLDRLNRMPYKYKKNPLFVDRAEYFYQGGFYDFLV